MDASVQAGSGLISDLLGDGLDDSHDLGELGEPKTRRRWTSDEDMRLQEGVKQFGDSKWKMVSAFVATRSPAQCLHRWRFSIKPSISRRKWTEEDDAKLLEAVAKHGKSWSLIGQYMGDRTGAQCRERYCNRLDPEIHRGHWTVQQDAKLRELVQTVGIGKWAQIAKMLTPPRTDYQIRKRWSVLSRGGGATTEGEHSDSEGGPHQFPL